MSKELDKDASGKPYKKGEVKICSSFEEQEEYNIKQVLQQKPILRVKETVDLILRMHGYTREA
jgi:hypothetical protein